MSADIVIPLGNGSKSHNDELKIFLRSIQENATGFDKIWIVTAYPPKWLKPDSILNVLWKEDDYKHNKDANLFEKIMLAMDVTKSESIVFSADDCAILMPVNLSVLPPIYNRRKIKDFSETKSKWQKRMIATLSEINLVDGNWDSHTPQLWNVQEAQEVIKTIPYYAPEGRCIDSAVMGRIYKSKIPPFAITQKSVKETCEHSNISRIKLNTLFIGYGDSGFLHGLRERLFERFPTPSRWEKK